MAKIQKSFALTMLMSLLVFAGLAAATIVVQGQAPAPPTGSPLPTHAPTATSLPTHAPTATPTSAPTSTAPPESPTPTMGPTTEPTVPPTGLPSPTIPSVSPPPGVGGIDWTTWGWVIGGLIALIALALIAWAVYSSRRNRYRHPEQDVHGHTNPDEADRRRVYSTENARTENARRTYSEEADRRNLRTEESPKRTVTEDTERHLRTEEIDKRLHPEDTEYARRHPEDTEYARRHPEESRS